MLPLNRLMSLVEFIWSSLAGAISLGAGLSISHLADRYTSPVKSNLIGLLIGSVINFLLQKRSFHYQGKTDTSLVGKFLLSETGVIILNHILFIIFIKSQKTSFIRTIKARLPTQYQTDSYVNSIARVIISVLVFSIFAFPARKYWIFHKSKSTVMES